MKTMFGKYAVGGLLLAGQVIWGAAASAQERSPIRWGVAVNASLSHALAPMLELDEELQAKYGLDFSTVDYNGGVTQCIVGIIANEAETCQNGITAGLHAMAEGADLRGMIQQIGQITEVTISTAAMEAAGLTAEAPVEERIAALRGLRIAGPGPGSSTYYLLEAILAEGGMTVNDVQFQPLVDTTAMNASIAAGRIDGAIWSAGGLSPAQAEGSAVRWVSLADNDVPHLRSIPNVVTFADATWAAENQELLSRVQAAFVEVVARLQADPFGYAAAYKQAHMPEISDEVWADILPLAVESYIPDMEGTREGWDFWVTLLDRDSEGDFTNVYYDKGFIPLSASN